MKVGTIKDLSEQPNMPSVVTLRAIIARNSDFPILQRGTRGRGYRIDLEKAAQFVLALNSPRVLPPEERQQAINSLGLLMISPLYKGN